MAQTGYTPIQLYYSSTTTNTPSAGNLANGELAINITDGKLFYKDNTGTVQTIAYKNVPLSTVTGTLGVTNGGTGVTTITGIIKGAGTSAFSAATAGTDYGAPGTASTWTASQRGTVTTANTGSFNMNTTNNWICTPTGTVTLTFTNITAGQSGFITLVNGSNYTIAKDAAVKVASGQLTTLSATGTYLLSYFSPDGTNVYLTATAALS